MSNLKKPVIILGAGGHAGVLIEVLNKIGIKILGLTVPYKIKEKELHGIKVIGDDSQVSNFSSDEVLLVNGLGSLPGDIARKNISSEMRENGYKFLTLAHPDTLISEKVNLSEGCQVMAGSILQYGTSIGIDTIINTGSIIDHECTIGSFCHIAPGSVLSGNVSIGDNTHIGTGTKIIQNVKIGEGVIVAAGSVVYKDISSSTKFIQKKA